MINRTKSDNVQFLRKLGQGAFGVVNLVKVDGKEYALKQITKKSFSNISDVFIET